jgi:hypothetical protein
LLCDAFLPSDYAPLSLWQEQEKNRAAVGGYEAAWHGCRAVPYYYQLFCFLYSRFSSITFFA